MEALRTSQVSKTVVGFPEPVGGFLESVGKKTLKRITGREWSGHLHYNGNPICIKSHLKLLEDSVKTPQTFPYCVWLNL